VTVVKSGRPARLALVGIALVAVSVWGWANLSDDGGQSDDSPVPTTTTAFEQVCMTAGAGEMVAVPDVIGQPADTALDVLREAGLCPIVNDGDPKRLVVTQDPLAGVRIPRGSEVLLRSGKP
jgi:hypothetical protein